MKGKTVEGRPYFAPTNETAHEKNLPEEAQALKEALGQAGPVRPTQDEEAERHAHEGRESKAELEGHTVDELKDIAETEGADLSGTTTKAEIIKAIQKNRRSKK